MYWLRRWWRQPDHYDWIMAYVRTRGLSRLWRIMIVGLTVVGSPIPLVLIAVPGGAAGEASRVTAAAATVCFILLALLWIVRIPTRKQSRFFVVGTTVCLAATVLTCADPFIAMFMCTVFVLPATYIAFLHTAPFMVLNFQCTILIAIVEAIRIGVAGRPLFGVCAVWLVFAVTTGAPASVQIIVHSLGIDLIQANSDPLTLTLNRRAFSIKTQELVYKRGGAGDHLVVMVVDLDGFKLLNDARGHPVGDRALLAVADVLRTQTRDTAVIGRVGGDEFVIADVTSRPRQTASAERLRAAIAHTPFMVTASIGVATIALGGIDDWDVESVIEDLVIAADRQMYVAKRAGGNMVQHADHESDAPEAVLQD